MLQCVRCKQVKPVDAFPLRCDRNIPLKHCSACAEAEDAARAKDAKELAAGVRTCTACKVTRPLEEFHARRGYGRGPGARQRKCRLCVSAYSARHYLSTRTTEEQHSRDEAAALVASGAVTRQCFRCKRDLPLLEFARDRRGPDGLKAACRACAHELYRLRRERVPMNRPRALDLRRYGITAEIYDLIAHTQGDACRVCGVPRAEVKDKYGFHVDHDHETGKVRGLLCRECNTALGHANDNPQILRGLIRYLELGTHAPEPGAAYATWAAYLEAQEKTPLAGGSVRTKKPS